MYNQISKCFYVEQRLQIQDKTKQQQKILDNKLKHHVSHRILLKYQILPTTSSIAICHTQSTSSFDVIVHKRIFFINHAIAEQNFSNLSPQKSK